MFVIQVNSRSSIQPSLYGMTLKQRPFVFTFADNKDVQTCVTFLCKHRQKYREWPGMVTSKKMRCETSIKESYNDIRRKYIQVVKMDENMLKTFFDHRYMYSLRVSDFNVDDNEQDYEYTFSAECFTTPNYEKDTSFFIDRISAGF